MVVMVFNSVFRCGFTVGQILRLVPVADNLSALEREVTNGGDTDEHLDDNVDTGQRYAESSSTDE